MILCILLSMQSRSRFVLSVFVILLCIAAAALVAVAIFSKRIDTAQRELLVVQAKQAALLVTPQDVASLSGTSADLANPLYQRLKSQLTAFREADPQIRFVYVMGYHPELRTQFFYVDSEPVNSDDYSPPGQIFPDTRQEDIERYLAGEPYTDGPYVDSWGEWVSGYVPMAGPSGDTVAMIGIDIATDVWHEQISFARTAISVIALLLAVVVLFIAFRFRKSQASIDDLRVRNQRLEKSRSALKQMQSMAHIGSITVYFPNKSMVLDEQLRSLLGLPDAERISFETLQSMVHLDDRQRFVAMIEEIAMTDIVYAWVDARIGSPERGFRKYHIYGNIKRDAAGHAERFDGIMQDITDIEK